MALPSTEELEKELAALDEKRRVTAALLSAAREYEKAVGCPVHSSRSLSVTLRQGTPPPRSNPMSVTEAVATELMNATGRPVATAQVVEEMRRRGLPLPEHNENNVISARLSNNKRFQAKRGYGYWFADRPWPNDDEFSELLVPRLAEDQIGA